MAESSNASSPKKKKKKDNVPVFVARRRLSSRKTTSTRTDSFEQLNSIIERHLTKKNQGVLIVNYKPVYLNSDSHESTPPKQPVRPSHDVPDIEDPFTYIETMYQQLFTEDGQLRSDTRPEVLANCVKQIVTQSRRNSMALREPVLPRPHQRNYSVTPSPHLISNALSEEEDEEESSTFRRRQHRSSASPADDHQQQLHAFLSSYYHQQRTPGNVDSVDDTDNEELDTFSDFTCSRRTNRPSVLISADEDAALTDSKLQSSGYHSLANTRSKVLPECHSPSNNTHLSLIGLIRPLGDVLKKYLDFLLISKNILIVPLFLFFLHQRITPLRVSVYS